MNPTVRAACCALVVFAVLSSSVRFSSASTLLPVDSSTQAHLIGGGVASLSAAVFLVQNSTVRAANIHVYDENWWLGGALDAFDPERAAAEDVPFMMRGGRMFEDKAFANTYAFLRAVPCVPFSAITPSDCKTLYDDYVEFNQEDPYHVLQRLVDGEGNVMDSTRMRFSTKDRLAMTGLLMTPEFFLGTKTIADVFPEHFFGTSFWYMWATTFSFEPWHSAVEMRRYMKRFIHLFPEMSRMSQIKRTRFAQYYSMVLPAVDYLRAHGVNFHLRTRVEDMRLTETKPAGFFSSAEWGVSGLIVRDLSTGSLSSVAVRPERDLVIATLGSITSSTSYATKSKATRLDVSEPTSFLLWQRLAGKVLDDRFGRPQVFTEHISASKWLSFTCTCRDAATLRAATAGAGTGLVTILSPWFMSVVHKYPSFPALLHSNTTLLFGYGLFPERVGRYVNKTMAQSSGDELLLELASHLKWTQNYPSLLDTVECDMALMPFITSQFLPRAAGDRPQVIPAGSRNLALVGQYVEMPKDVVFTVEYSVHSAMQAVQSLVAPDLTIEPVYRGDLDPAVLLNAMKVMMT